MKKLKKTLSIFSGGILVGIATISNHPTYPLVGAMGIFIIIYTLIK